jgi:hypothetical protein
LAVIARPINGRIYNRNYPFRFIRCWSWFFWFGNSVMGLYAYKFLLLKNNRVR